MNYKVLLLFLVLTGNVVTVKCQGSGDNDMLYEYSSISGDMDTLTSPIMTLHSSHIVPVASSTITIESTSSVAISMSATTVVISSLMPSTNIVVIPSTSSMTTSTSTSISATPSISIATSTEVISPSTSLSTSTKAVFSTNTTISTKSMPSTAIVTSSTSVSNPIVTISTEISSSTSVTPTSTPDNVWQPFLDFFERDYVRYAAGGVGIIIILLLIICCLCCCYCCCHRRRDKYVIEGHYDENLSNGGVRNRHYVQRPSISGPQSYQMALRKAQTERQKLEDFVETEIGEVSVDDGIHYQGHSQVQHSQAYSPLETGSTMQSLSKLTPLNPSQIMHQAHGSISVDDDDDLPQRDEKDRQTGGGDSPFMHLSDKSDNMSVPQSKHSLDDPPSVINESSQYSYLGLGVHHGSDVVITNTASLMEDPDGGGVGMIGIDKALISSHGSDVGSRNQRVSSPILEVSKSSEELDDTPVLLQHEPVKRKISASSSQVPSSTRDFARLTSIGHEAQIAKLSTPQEDSPTKDPEGESRHLNLSAITSLRRSPNSSSMIPNNNSDLQETPERQRSSTVTSGNPTAFRRASNSAKATRLGKLTSLEYIRASLRMKLKKMSTSKEPDNERKKPLKSALRKTGSVSSQHSTSSLESSGSHHHTYTNRHALDYSMETSPAPSSLSSPQHYSAGHLEYPPPDDFMLQDGYGGPGYAPHGAGAMGYPQEPYTNPIALSPSGYGPELSPILSVSQFDYPHPMMYPPQEVGILPSYSGYNQMSYHDPYFPPQPPMYDDEDDDDNLPALHTSLRNIPGASQSQRNVTWNLKTEEIPPTPVELTPSSSSDNEQA